MPSSKTSTAIICARPAELFKALIGALPYLPGGPEIEARLDDQKRAQLRAAIPGLKERAKTLVELLDGAAFLFATRPLTMDAKAEEILARAGRIHLTNLLPRLAGLKDWTAESAEQVVRAYAEEQGAKLGLVAQPLRAALTGRSTSPGIFDVLEVLGRDESLGRIEDQARLGA
jgi:glutamyl-tRNA synthetase